MVTLRCLVPVAVLGNQYIYRDETRPVSGATADLLLDEDPPRFEVVAAPQNLQEPAPDPLDSDGDSDGNNDDDNDEEVSNTSSVNLNEPATPLPPRNERPARKH